MKKIMITFLMLMVLISQFMAGSEQNEKNKFFFSIKGNFLSPSDNSYKDIYSSFVVYPGINAGFKVLKKIYIFFGYDYLKKKGKTPVLLEDAESTQNIFSLGAVYEGRLSNKFSYRVEAGGVSFSYKEEALGESASGSKIGIILNGGFVYNFGKKLFLSFLTGFTSASDKLEGINIKLGGFGSSIGIGLRF